MSIFCLYFVLTLSVSMGYNSARQGHTMNTNTANPKQTCQPMLHLAVFSVGIRPGRIGARPSGSAVLSRQGRSSVTCPVEHNNGSRESTIRQSHISENFHVQQPAHSHADNTSHGP